MPNIDDNISVFPNVFNGIQIRKQGVLDPVAGRLAILAYVGAESLVHVVHERGELAIDDWRTRITQTLTSLKLVATNEEIAWIQKHLPFDPNLQHAVVNGRESLNQRLHSEPVLPAGATIALFMRTQFGKKRPRIQHPRDVGDPDAWIRLEQPLHFYCRRGTDYEIRESPVVARMRIAAIPDWTGRLNEQARLFTLSSEEDIQVEDDYVSLKYPSLNKVYPGIFNRLHLGEGKQNTNRSIYYHAGWATRDASDHMYYQSLWSIRDSVIDRSWSCPGPIGAPINPTP